MLALVLYEGGKGAVRVNGGGRVGSRRKEGDLRGIIPAGIPPGMPNGGGGTPPVEGTVSMCVFRTFIELNAHRLRS